jgi:hypothetical protein
MHGRKDPIDWPVPPVTYDFGQQPLRVETPPLPRDGNQIDAQAR